MIRMMTLTFMALALSVAAASAQQGSVRTAPALSADAPVNLNSATVPQLEALPGIGKATAERIVEYREKNGGFKKIEEKLDILDVGHFLGAFDGMLPRRLAGPSPDVAEPLRKCQGVSDLVGAVVGASNNEGTCELLP